MARLPHRRPPISQPILRISPKPVVRCTAALLAQLWQLAAASPEVEVCGVLLGTRDGMLEMVLPGHNLAVDPRHHFVLDAATLLQADTLARTADRRVVGFYHSHPSGLPVPSVEDRGTMWEATVNIIIGGRALQPVLAAWRLQHGRLQPVLFVLEGDLWPAPTSGI